MEFFLLVKTVFSGKFGHRTRFNTAGKGQSRVGKLIINQLAGMSAAERSLL